MDRRSTGLENIARHVQRQPAASKVRTTRELLLVLQALAKSPVGVQRAKEVDPGVGPHKDHVLEATKEATQQANSESEHSNCKSPPLEMKQEDVKPESPFEMKECDVQPESPPAEVKQGDVQQGDVQPESPPAEVKQGDVQPNDVQHPNLQDDFSDEANRWKDVEMPLPLQVVRGQCPRPPPRLLPKVLVLDMNGVLLRRYPYPEIPPPRSPVFPSRRVYKGGNDCGTFCIMRPDAYEFVEKCGSMFYLCLWSSCSLRNINTAMKDCFKGLHPKIWKKILSQAECTKMPFNLTDIRELRDSREKPVFAKGLRDLLSLKPEWQGLSILIVDDTRYKNMLNHDWAMICPPPFEPVDQSQDPRYLTRILLPWLKGWIVADDPDAYVRRNMISNDRDQVSQLVINHWLQRCTAESARS